MSDEFGKRRKPPLAPYYRGQPPRDPKVEKTLPFGVLGRASLVLMVLAVLASVAAGIALAVQ